MEARVFLRLCEYGFFTLLWRRSCTAAETAALDGVTLADDDEPGLGRCNPSRLSRVDSIFARLRSSDLLPQNECRLFEVVVSSESVSLSESSHKFGYLDLMAFVGLRSIVLVSALALPLLSTVSTMEVRDLGAFGVDASSMEARDVVEFRLARLSGEALLWIPEVVLLRPRDSIEPYML